jgi:hypothetical protein
MDLLSSVDHVGLLAGHCRVGRHSDGDTEALFQRTEMRAFVIEHIKRDFGPRTHDQIVRCA